MTEEVSSPTHSKLKEMRRIPEKTEAPTDKTELIQYLSTRIKQAEVPPSPCRTLSTILRNYWTQK